MRSSSRKVASLSLRVAELSDSVTMAFSLTPSCCGEDLGTPKWRCHDNTYAQQQYDPAAACTTNASTRTTHSTTSNVTLCARLTIATWSVRPSRWSAPTFAIKDATTSSPRTPSSPEFGRRLFNPSRRQMLRHQDRHVLICGEPTSAGIPLSAAAPVSTCAESPSVRACLCLSCGRCRGKRSYRSTLVESPRNPPRSGSGTLALHPRLQAWNSASALDSATSDCVADAASSG